MNLEALSAAIRPRSPHPQKSSPSTECSSGEKTPTSPVVASKFPRGPPGERVGSDQSSRRQDDPTELVEAQETTYWDTYRRCQNYEVAVVCHRACLVMLDNAATLPDPYVIMFKKDDRAGTKTKTSVVKKTTYPEWEEVLVLENLRYDDEIVAEVKHSNTLGGNQVLGKFSFFVHETLSMMNETIPKLLEPFGTGEITLSITAWPPVPWGGPLAEPVRTESVLKPVRVLRRRPDFKVGELDPCYLRTDTAGYACMLLDGDGADGNGTFEERLAQLVPSRRRALLPAGLQTLSIMESPTKGMAETSPTTSPSR